MDQELVAYLEKRFGAIDECFTAMDERFAAIDERFDRVDEAIRRTQVLVEDTRREVQLVAEGVIGAVEQVQSLRADIEQRFAEYKNHDIRLRFLEEKAGREGQSALEYLKEQYGRKST